MRVLVVVVAAVARALAPPKVAVVGGGLGGLASGIALRKTGFDVTVFERAATLEGYAGTGLTLWPNGQAALAGIDEALSATLQTIGAPTDHIEVTDASGENPLPNPTGDPRRFPAVYGFPMRNVRWSTLRSCLAARFAEVGGTVVLDRSCVGFDEKADALRLVDHSGAARDVEGFDVVVGADGLHSALRAQLVDDGAPRDAGRTIWRAVIPFTRDLRRLLALNSCSMSAGSGKVGFLTDIGDDLLYWSAFATDEALAASTVDRAAHGDDVKAYLAEEFADVFKLLPCVEATPAASILERRVSDRAPLVDGAGAPQIPWTSGKVTLLGDAFHAMIPSLGQGANSSFEGAYRLARALHAAPDGDLEAALRAYEAGQMARVASIVDASARQGKMVYEDKDAFMKNQAEAQDEIWGVSFAPLV